MSEYSTKKLTIEDKIEIMREVLIKFINGSELTWERRNYLLRKLDEIKIVYLEEEKDNQNE